MSRICIFIFLLLLPELSFSSHAMGGNISYVDLGELRYEVTYTFYRDCSGIPAPSTASLIAATQNGSSTSFTLLPTAGSPVQLHLVCPTALTTCAGGNNIGVEKWVYTGVITVPNEPVILYHVENARSAGLTTVNGAGGDLYIYATINHDSSLTNNSPVFLTDPTIVLCQGTQYCLPSYVTDVEGDSLAYQLIGPRNGTNVFDTVTFLPGYSSNQPFTSSPPVTLNPVTGDLCLTPTAANEVSPVAILVSEFRNGVLIGQVERDMQIFVELCPNLQPQITGINGVPSHTLNVCAGQQNCFFITAVDADTSDVVFVNWDISIPNANTIHTFGNRDTLFICWTPSDSDTLTNPHCFYASASDNSCPYPVTTYGSYCLNVIPVNVCNPTANIDEIDYQDFAVFPQPSKDEVFFEFENVSDKYLIIYSTVGDIISKIPVEEKLIRVETGMMDGIYIAVIADRSGMVFRSKRILIMK